MSELETIQAALSEQNERQRRLEEAYNNSQRNHPYHPFRGTYTGLRSESLFLTGQAICAVNDALAEQRCLDAREEQRVRLALQQAPAPTKGMALLSQWSRDGMLPSEDRELLLQILRWIEEVYP